MSRLLHSRPALPLEFREAQPGDLGRLVELLANDPLGRLREDPSQPLNPSYHDAFESIRSDPNNQLVVAESSGQLVGMLQLTFIPYITHTGSWRCLIEGVRVDEDHRGKGWGASLIRWAISRAQERGCHLVQLTSDKQRPEALKFYESLGFQATHEGFKLKL